jgi:2-aminoadipate transaminase
MKTQAQSLFSDLARSVPPFSWPAPPVPVTHNFDQGLPGEETFPLGDLKRLAVEILERDEGRALEYISFDYEDESRTLSYLSSYPEMAMGFTGLRQELAAWAGRVNNRPDLTAGHFILAAGSVQAIALAINAFVDPGDGVLTEAVTFPYASRYITMRGADLRTVLLDEDGLSVDHLEKQLTAMRADGTKPKLLYTIPTFQLPTGLCTSLERRKRIIELAREWNIVIIEDAIYSDLRYDGERVPSLLELDDSGLVIQSHAFSKTVAPAIRLGWVAGDPEIVAGLARVRQDLGVSQWTARMMAEYVRSGLLDSHIDDIKAVYRRKRDLAVAAVRDNCGSLVTFRVPDGGFYLWLRLSNEVDWESVQRQAELKGVYLRPGEKFAGAGASDGNRYLRLAFSHASESQLVRGIETLGSAIRAATS